MTDSMQLFYLGIKTVFDKKLLEITYPCKGSAFVEAGFVRDPWRTGHRMGGQWIKGEAVGVYYVGKTPLYVVFMSTNKETYLLEFSAQLIAYGQID